MSLTIRSLSCAVVVLSLVAAGLAQTPAAPPSAAPPSPATSATVLDGASYWRTYHTLKPPVIDLPGGLKPLPMFQHWLTTDSAEPPANWMAADFDDAAWLRGPARMPIDTPYLARACARGKFLVDDPAKVGPLKLALDYHGGAVVYLNGKEIARRNLAAGADVRTTLAEGYPNEAFVADTGELLAHEGQLVAAGKRQRGNTPEAKRRLGLAKRTLDDLTLPRDLLRQGVNVLAIEIIRSPYPKVLEDFKAQNTTKDIPPYQMRWSTCQMGDVRLTAPTAAGLNLSTARPPGLQVWNGDTLVPDFTNDCASPCEKLRPVSIVAARNGAYSGQVVIGSSKTIRGLTVTPGDLHAGASTIPAAAVQIRYGIPWGSEFGTGRAGGNQFGAVIETAPPEFTAGPSGAVLPIWITVKPGKDAVAGAYTGDLKIAAADEKPVTVTVQVQLMDFTLPDPQNYRTVVELIESPDTLALEYNVPLWSDKHFAMIADSFRLISATGARIVYLPVIAHTNLGNAESMVRWIKTGENQYDFDFTVMDKYLDSAQKNLGTPKVVVLQVWDLYMSTKESVGVRFSPELDQRHQVSKGRPQVTLLNKATGQTELGTVPDLNDPASKAIWKKLIDAVRQRLQQRGLDKTLMFGMFTDAMPSKEHFLFFKDIAPEVPWVMEGHNHWTEKIYGLATIGLQASVWGGYQFADGQLQQGFVNKVIPVTSHYGWKSSHLDLVFERNTGLDHYPLSRWRFFAETGVTSDLRGVGRIGADYWKAVKDNKGQRQGYAHERFVEGTWSGGGIQLNLTNTVLAPGPSGPVATTRLLAFNEGIQDCEARIAIEQALVDAGLKAKLGPELAQRCQDCLDGRLDTIWKSLSNLGVAENFGAWSWRWSLGVAGNVWYLSTDRRQQSETLYQLAGEVAKKTGR